MNISYNSSKYGLYTMELIMKNADELGSLLKKRRKYLKQTQQAVEDISGISASTISDIECGKNFPKLDTLLVLLELYGLEMNIDVKKIDS
jgi:transcriptional regulator with XRE-family HTH domain